MRISRDGNRLTIEPPRAYYLVAYGFVVVFGGAGLVYAAGILFLAPWPANVGVLEKAIYVGLPLLFVATLAWWALGDNRGFRFDRDAGQLFDGDRPIVALNEIANVAVRLDEGETSDFFPIELTLTDGRRISLRRNLWPMDGSPDEARAKAQIVAEFLGVGVESTTAR